MGSYRMAQLPHTHHSGLGNIRLLSEGDVGAANGVCVVHHTTPDGRHAAREALLHQAVT